MDVVVEIPCKLQIAGRERFHDIRDLMPGCLRESHDTQENECHRKNSSFHIRVSVNQNTRVAVTG